VAYLVPLEQVRFILFTSLEGPKAKPKTNLSFPLTSSQVISLLLLSLLISIYTLLMLTKLLKDRFLGTKGSSAITTFELTT
jgi:hypothetical protein